MPALIEKVPGFNKHIRVFIVHTLATTFQDSTRQNLEQCLDLVSERGLLLASSRGVGVGLNVVFIFFFTPPPPPRAFGKTKPTSNA